MTDEPAIEMARDSGGPHVMYGAGNTTDGYTHTTTTTMTTNGNGTAYGNGQANGYKTNGYSGGNGLLTEGAANMYGVGQVDGHADGYRGNSPAPSKSLSASQNF